MTDLKGNVYILKWASSLVIVVAAAGHAACSGAVEEDGEGGGAGETTAAQTTTGATSGATSGSSTSSASSSQSGVGGGGGVGEGGSGGAGGAECIPAGSDVCDGADNDCDGTIDDDCHPSCLAILTADASSTDGAYIIDVDGHLGPELPIAVTCDMTTDGGGWTQVAALDASTAQAQASILAFDDLGIASYTEALIVDQGSFSEYDFNVPSWWEWSGYDIARNALLIDGAWYIDASEPTSRGVYDPGLFTFWPHESYAVLQAAQGDVCYYGGFNAPAYCGSVVRVTLPSGGAIQGLSDVESVSDQSIGDDQFTVKLDVFVR